MHFGGSTDDALEGDGTGRGLTRTRGKGRQWGCGDQMNVLVRPRTRAQEGRREKHPGGDRAGPQDYQNVEGGREEARKMPCFTDCIPKRMVRP